LGLREQAAGLKKSLTLRIGAWAGVLFFSVGLGMLLTAVGTRHMSPRQWALAAGIDLPTWCALGGILLAGGICLVILVRRPPRK
jgi:hypothetical protein